jgi:hypothetical protein
MDLIIDEEEIKEITLDNFINPNDHAKITIVGEMEGMRHEGKDEITKEIIANDALVYGASKAAELNGVVQSSASKYKDGMDIKDENAKARILTKKYDIADVATTKLMDALGLIEVRDIEKPLDKIRAASMLSNIVEKVTERSDKGGNTIQLHLYAPKQREVSKYEVIDV